MFHSRYFMVVFLSLAILAHIGCIIFGREWYLFFGAGEHMAKLADQGSIMHIYITSFVISILSLMLLYNLSVMGFVPKLPLLKFGLVSIAIVFFLRAIVGFFFLIYPAYSSIPENGSTFWLVSSIICLIVAWFQFRQYQLNI